MAQVSTVRATALLLAFHALLTLSRLPATLKTPVGPTLFAITLLALLFGIGIWRHTRWAWWGSLLLVLALLSWQAIAGAMLLGTPEGRVVLRKLAAMPVALGTALTDLALLVLLLLPGTRRGLRRAAA